ncbi:MAG: DUF58 domain-containing protein [Magnetococcales bacterium]|nr:DUF58 domain-containing protein [Magnetococcales bacterium]
MRLPAWLTAHAHPSRARDEHAPATPRPHGAATGEATGSAPPVPAQGEDPVIDIDALLALRHAAPNIPPTMRRHLAAHEGGHATPRKGRGMEFAETRLYQPGDEVRHMAWRVTARTGKHHVKLFREERERALFVWIDCRGPMFHATRGQLKIVQAARAATFSAWYAARQGDRIGALLFSEQAHVELRPTRGDRAVIGLIRTLHRFGEAHPIPVSPTGGEALALALTRLQRVLLPGSQLLLCGDFRGLRPEDHALLAQLARRHAVTIFFPHDPLERTLPPAGGRYPITSADTGGQRFLLVDDPNARQAHAARFAARHDGLRDLCQRIGAGFVSCSTEEEATTALRIGLHGRAA